jgi:hypothetical protein
LSDFETGQKDSILDVISEIPQSTEDINKQLGTRYCCPEDLLRALNVLKRKGLIKGEFSKTSSKWVWWKIK